MSSGGVCQQLDKIGRLGSADAVEQPAGECFRGEIIKDTVESLRHRRVPVPQISDYVELWLPASVVEGDSPHGMLRAIGDTYEQIEGLITGTSWRARERRCSFDRAGCDRATCSRLNDRSYTADFGRAVGVPRSSTATKSTKIAAITSLPCADRRQSI